ncbi:hypothetical protein FQR65_LT20874 [Abscondita terminalis]|nr:hypothetical protein FQR65_LT20874 [Abscondita terminalis]
MEQHKLYIGSEWVPASGGDVFAANNPATGEQIAEVALGTLEDIDRAVNAARSAASTVLAQTSNNGAGSHQKTTGKPFRQRSPEERSACSEGLSEMRRTIPNTLMARSTRKNPTSALSGHRPVVCTR